MKATKLLREFLILVEEYQITLKEWYCNQSELKKLKKEKLLYRKLMRASKALMYNHNFSGWNRIEKAIQCATACKPAR